MRKLFLALSAILTLAACSSDLVYHDMTTQQKEAYAKSVAGDYEGTYIIIYNEEGGNDKAIKIEGAKVTVTDQTLQSVFFHDYPVSQLSHVIKNAELAEALAKQPNIDLTATYRFFDLQDNGDVNWGYDPIAIPLTLHYGDADHHVVLKASNSHTYFRLSKANLDAGMPFAYQGVFQLSFDGIYESDVLLEEFDGIWQNNTTYLTYFQLDK